MKLKITIPVKYIVAEVVGIISWWPELVFQGFQCSDFCSGSPAALIRFHRTTVKSVFVCLFFFVVDGYGTTILYNCLLEASVDDILSQVYNNADIYTQTHINTYSHIYKHTRTLTWSSSYNILLLPFGDIWLLQV